MPPQLQAAARFVLENPKRVALLSMRAQARRVGVSHTTMVRLATWLGLDSYEELRAICARALDAAPDNARSSRADVLGPGVTNSDHAAVRRMANTFAAQVNSFHEDKIARQFLAAAGILGNSRRIFCLGLHSAHTLARHVGSLLSSLGTNAIVLDTTTGCGMGVLQVSGAEDSLLALSFAPHTDATLTLAHQASRRGIAVIGVTDSRSSALVHLARASIVIPTNSWSALPSMTAALSAMEILAALLVDQTNDDRAKQRVGEPFAVLHEHPIQDRPAGRKRGIVTL